MTKQDCQSKKKIRNCLFILSKKSVSIKNSTCKFFMLDECSNDSQPRSQSKFLIKKKYFRNVVEKIMKNDQFLKEC